MREVYDFMIQDGKLEKKMSMRAMTILGKISKWIRECAHFISNYSETSNFCECHSLLRSAPSQASTIITGKRLGKNVFKETTDTIQKYNDALDMLMQDFRDQVLLDAATHVHDIDRQLHDIDMQVHDIGKDSDVLAT